MQQAIARLRAYKPPPLTAYHGLPLTRKAAVLILLFPDKRGDLRVVLTMRASTLSSYAGHAALPGGKADTLEETPFQTARREAWEEVGLPMDDKGLPKGFKVEHLCEMPTNLAKTELGVRPCVAFLSTGNEASNDSNGPSLPSQSVEESLIPRLDAKEVAAVFSAPFHSFLLEADEHSENAGQDVGVEAAGFPAQWYRGSWTDWHESRWRMHNFYVPIKGQRVTKPREKPKKRSEEDSDGAGKTKASPEAAGSVIDEAERYRVFGMTARILVDAARVAYAQEPQFEHNSHFGDEEMIQRLVKIGRMGPVRKKGEELTRDVLRKAARI